MSAEFISILTITIYFLGWFIYNIIREKSLNKYLLEHGVEIEAQARYLGVYDDVLKRVEVTFSFNGQIISKRMRVLEIMWNPTSGNNIKEFPILVDPKDPKRFLFNMRKFNLNKPSDDSIRNFLERNKAENQDLEDV